MTTPPAPGRAEDAEEQAWADLAAQQDSILAESAVLRGEAPPATPEPVTRSAASPTPGPQAPGAQDTSRLLATRAALQERLQAGEDGAEVAAAPEPAENAAGSATNSATSATAPQTAQDTDGAESAAAKQAQARQGAAPAEAVQSAEHTAADGAAQGAAAPAPTATAQPAKPAATGPDYATTEPGAADGPANHVAEPEPAGPAGEATQAAQVDSWSASVDGLEVSGRVRQLLLHSTLATPAEAGTDAYVLTIASDQQALASEQALANLRTALTTLVGDKEVRVEYGDPGRTPFVIQQEIDSRRLDEATAMVERHPAITRLREALQAEIVPGSIKPL